MAHLFKGTPQLRLEDYDYRQKSHIKGLVEDKGQRFHLHYPCQHIAEHQHDDTLCQTACTGLLHELYHLVDKVRQNSDIYNIPERRGKNCEQGAFKLIQQVHKSRPFHIFV